MKRENRNGARDRDIAVEWDLGYHARVPYSADSTTPVHRWFLINESQSLAQMNDLFCELDVAEGDLVIDPFSGSGTVALQSAIVGADFLGVELLATCVIASRAKLAAAEVERFHLVVQAAASLSVATRIQEEDRATMTTGAAHDELRTQILANGDRPVTWILLAALYAAASRLDARASTGAAGVELAHRFQIGVGWVLQDLDRFRTTPGDRRVHWGSGVEMDWAAAVTPPKSGRAFLITSPPFPKSCQNIDPTWERPAGEDLQRLGSVAPTAESPSSAPGFEELAGAALHRLRELDVQRRAGVFECCCPAPPGGETPLDIRVGMLAESIGLGSSMVRVTHFVDDGGRPTRSLTSTRGSLVFFGCNKRGKFK